MLERLSLIFLQIVAWLMMLAANVIFVSLAVFDPRFLEMLLDDNGQMGRIEMFGICFIPCLLLFCAGAMLWALVIIARRLQRLTPR